MSIFFSCRRDRAPDSLPVFAALSFLLAFGWGIVAESVATAAMQKAGGEAGRGGYVVQLDAFASLEAAQGRLEALQVAGVSAYVVKSELAGRGTLYRVRHGRFATPAEARLAGTALQSRGLIESFFVAAYEPPLAWASPSPRGARPASTVTPATPPTPATPATPAGSGAAGNAPVPSSPGARSAPVIRYQEVVDPAIGYTFEVPASWQGGIVSEGDRQRRGIEAGATFQSPPDRAFLNVVWNGLPNAHQKESELILTTILHSLRVGGGVKRIEEINRQVERPQGQIVRTHLELVATFQIREGEPLLDFEGRAVVLQTPRGVLLLVCFYGFDAPPETEAQVQRIIASAKAP